MREICEDILATKVEIDGVQCWNRRYTSKLGTAGVYERYVRSLCQKRLLKLETIGNKDPFFPKLRTVLASKFDSLSNLQHIRIYKVMDGEALFKLANGQTTLSELPD